MTRDRVSPVLEVIDKGDCSEIHPAPLLFVHGGFHAAWCWDEHFLDFFADKGFRAIAVSLRGHGLSSSSTPLNTCSIADYVNDVGSVADSLSTSPVLIGHSMGGYVIQKYLESHRVPAAVLISSAPPAGVGGLMWRLTKRQPLTVARTLLTRKALHYFNTTKRARRSLFSTNTPESDVARFGARLQEESARAMLDMMRNRPKPRLVRTPMLVLGAENDGSVTIDEVRSTARAYRTEPEMFPDMGHDMMLEPGWAAVAERIHAWLYARSL